MRLWSVKKGCPLVLLKNVIFTGIFTKSLYKLKLKVQPDAFDWIKTSHVFFWGKHPWGDFSALIPLLTTVAISI